MTNNQPTTTNYLPLSNEARPPTGAELDAEQSKAEEDNVDEPRPNEKIKIYLERQRYLSDLHTHLLGMGNTGFWIDSIIENKDILPTHLEFCEGPALREQLCPLIWNTHRRGFIDGKCTAQFIDLLIQRNFPKNKIHDSELTNVAKLDSNAAQHDREAAQTTNVFKELIGDIQFNNKLNQYGLSFGNAQSSTTEPYKGPSKHTIKGDFTYDVVLTLSDLGKGLGVTIPWMTQNGDLIQSKVEEKLGLHVYPRPPDFPSEPFRRRIVFNAREQKFQVVKGITIDILRKLINVEANAPATECILARAHLQNAFSMCNPDGTAPRLIDFDKFHGSFTPEFYPRRFALKDSLYSQRLDILATLLKYVLERYQNCRPPIKYCELSIGVRDLCRPWVFDILRSFPAYEPIIGSELKPGSFRILIEKDHFPHLRNAFKMPSEKPLSCTLNVVYKFLAGFNRQELKGYSLENRMDALRLLNDSPNLAIHYMLKEIAQSEAHEQMAQSEAHEQIAQSEAQEPNAQTNRNCHDEVSIFSDLISQLGDLEKIFSEIPDYYHWVVGLDLFGDEMGYPYCPFVAWPFRRFVANQCIGNKDFGLRIHCGENVLYADADSDAYRHFIAHMYIVFRCLRYLQQKSNVRIRIGHGIAFARILGDGMSKSHHRKSSVLLAEIRDHAKHVLNEEIAFEVNLTSNEYLLGPALRRGNAQQPVRLNPLEEHVPIILSTDDDGVWPIDHCPSKHPGHHSLAAEYCRAISSSLIKDSQQLYKMLHNTQKFRFYSVFSGIRLPQDLHRGAENTDGTVQQREHQTGVQVQDGQTTPDSLLKKSVFPDGDTNPFTIVFHPDLIKTVLKKHYDCGLTTGKFYKDFERLYDQEKISSFCIPDNEKIWKIRCNTLAPIAFVAHCTLTDVPSDQSFQILSDEYRPLFGEESDLELLYEASNMVKNQFMVSTQADTNSYIKDTNSNKHTTFLSLSSHEQQLDSLLQYLKNEKITAGRIRVFAQQVAESAWENIPNEESIDTCADCMELEVFTTNRKDECIGAKRRRLNMNKHPTKRTGVWGSDEQHALYVICEHASAATAYLHYIGDTLPVYQVIVRLIEQIVADIGQVQVH